MNIVFDLDGTLSDPFPGISRSIIYALNRLAIPAPPVETLAAWIGPPLRHSFDAYFQSASLDADPDLAVSYYRERFAASGLYENRLYPDIQPLLVELKTDNRLLLATSKPLVFAEQIIRNFELDSYFKQLYGSKLDGSLTDKRELLEHLLERESISPASCLMIGDRKFDIQAANALGMAALAVAWGYGSFEELTAAGAATICSTPAGLLTELKRLGC